jgi:acyl transferase domain-containing protein
MTGEFARLLGDVRPRPPTIPFVSNVTGRWITPEQATDPWYWAQQAVRPVRFREGVALLLNEDRRILLEVGPGHTLCTLARQHRTAVAEHSVLPSLGEVKAPDGDDRALASALARVWLAGGAVDWASHWPERRWRVPLPGYPFEPQRHWIEPPAATAVAEQPAPPPEAVLTDPLTTADERGDEPPDEVAERIRLVWQEMLGHSGIGLHDDFFELGGHSLLAIRVTARLGEEFGIQLPIDCLFDARMIAQLARVVSDRLASGAERQERDDVRIG